MLKTLPESSMIIGTKDKTEVKKVSAQGIVTAMEKLVQVHEILDKLAGEKTEAIKKGDISHLQSLLQKEVVQVKLLQQLEQERVRHVRSYQREKGFVTENGTLTELLSYVTAEEKHLLATLQQRLLDVIKSLKEKNDLNQKLIHDSLRFVNLSLDMIKPQAETGNYGRPNKEDDEPEGRSLFDSKA
ncbi:flagellar protein FlgN [Anaerobacillus alkaliphilus]|uniref:Flagellar protein FlgN n=1 Tax=Anaerobacillus alkaliphilus TaxID=1548597 RepID=A0A4Q0VUC6_9BACI|nr:flagellar protein FlgN [Anaerobacillus alkaliphilus]RXJ02287.1 flagellar protein FlgN [Anaerobacillus alkaliphilus]